MPVPKRRHSRSRRDKRRTHVKASLPHLTPCPRCDQLRRPHRVCLHCGYYGDQEIVVVEKR